MSTFTRRELLRLSGVSLASGLVLAACGKQAGVIDDEAIAVLGQSQILTPLAEAEVTDAVLLRTAASLEYNAIETYATALDLGVFTGDLRKVVEIAKRFSDDHGNHADAVALSQAVDELLLGPWIFEACRFDIEHCLEISTNQPPDMYRLL